MLAASGVLGNGSVHDARSRLYLLTTFDFTEFDTPVIVADQTGTEQQLMT